MPDPELLRDIGINSTNVENAWAGAADDLARGLKFWTRSQIGRDRKTAVRAAHRACRLVLDDYKPVDGLPPRKYLDDMVELIERWMEQPSAENAELVRASLDVTRTAHAWQHEQDVESFWILEAVDHASLAVWSGERSSYIVPMDYATCAARSVTCVLHAMIDAGRSEDAAVALIVEAVKNATA